MTISPSHETVPNLVLQIFTSLNSRQV